MIIEFQFISIDPHEQYIPGLDDNPVTRNYNFAYPILDSTIGTVGLILLIFLPWYTLWIISTICLYIIDKNFSWIHWRQMFYLMTRMIFFSFSVCLLITDLIKLFCGSPRPYYLDIYDEYLLDKVDEYKIIDARLSFLSGHSSLSFSQLFLLSIMFYKSWQYTQKMYYNSTYLIGMTCDNPHSYYLCGFWWLLKEVPLIGIILVFVPTLIAIYCSLTRITDYKHFAVDVVGGTVLGGSIAYLSYLIFYNETYCRFNYKLKMEIKKLRAHNNNNNNDNNKHVVVALSEMNE